MQQLSRTRQETLESSAAELRRLERDLHDGTQGRLVAMGMTISTAQALMRTDPQAAEALLSEAKDASSKALGELRDLVRGIHPPVLADRGLADAVRALAADCVLPVRVSADIPARCDLAVESAAYFAVSELLTNVVKHAQASRIDVDMWATAGELRASVTDDGRGGADPGAGVRRRPHGQQPGRRPDGRQLHHATQLLTAGSGSLAQPGQHRPRDSAGRGRRSCVRPGVMLVCGSSSARDPVRCCSTLHGKPGTDDAQLESTDQGLEPVTDAEFHTGVG